MKRITFLSVMMISLLVFPGKAYATSPQVDMDYEGTVDIYTGEPVYDGSGDSAVTQMIGLPGGGSYDRTSHFFVYQDSAGGGNVQVTVADGMITTQTVSVVPQEGTEVYLYRDGTAVTDQELTSISLPGVYSILGAGGDDSRQIMSFTIVPEITGDIDSYTLPTGFYVTSMTHNGEVVEGSSVNTIDLKENGDYDIEYRCQTTGVDYSLVLTMDHDAPELILDGVENGRANGPVTISGLNEGETLTILRDGNEVNLPMDSVLRDSGTYELTATDEAGNVTRAGCVIGMYLNNQAIVFFLLFIGIIAAAIGFMVYSKKKLRIR